MKITSQLPFWNTENKRILLRADLNVPLQDGKIVNDFRLQATLPTIDYILDRNGIVVLITHIGRPTNHDPHLSTQHLIPWFEQRGYTIEFANTIEAAQEKIKSAQPKTIILLENLRFFPGEKAQDGNFAQQLAQLGDYYVNDAFGMMHREDTSITLVPQQFAPEKRSIGFLIEKELRVLNAMLEQPKRPLVVIIGGGKVTDKIPVIEHLLDKANTLLLCPAIVFTFAKALGKQVGKSLVDDNALALCKQIFQQAKEKNVNVVFPVDYQIALNTIQGPLSIVPSDTIPDDGVGISIGPQTAQHYSEIMSNAGTIFFNGAMGFLERKETLQGMKAIFDAMGQSNGMSIIAGGDSVATAQVLDATAGIDHLSSGGGATLAYLTGKPLPGIIALKAG